MTDVSGVSVATGAGQLRGDREGGCDVFRGVPFAAPPHGARRLAPPQPPDPWDGVRDATRFGFACPQGGTRGRSGVFGGLFGPGELETSEDCLTLNVWTPGCDGARRPVMVWIHGGAFALGTGASPTYDGRGLAERGDVVVVTINYRLGPLGFLYLPEIGAVNLGLLDQVVALEWVRDHIDAFGGDPAHVTVFGESAGGKSIECLLAMPRARGLFRRAILQSTYALPMDPEQGRQRSAGLLRELGLPAEHPERLRDVSVDDLLAANQQAAGGGLLGGTGPVVDGEIIPEHPPEAVRSGVASGVPLVIGTTRDESRLFGALAPGASELDEEELRRRLADTLPGAARDPELAARAIEIYRRSLSERGVPAGPADVWFATNTDRMFRQHSIGLAEAHATHEPDVYMYLFEWPSPVYEGRLGACHALELPFVFGTLDGDLGTLAGDGPASRELSERMQGAWLAFAREGVPTHAGLPEWPRYEPGRRRTMVFGPQTAPREAPLEAERLLWA